MGCCQPINSHDYKLEEPGSPKATVKRFLLSASDFITVKTSNITDEYTFQGLISRSGYSLIQKATHIATSSQRAIKTIPLPSDTILTQTLVQELSILKKLDHPGVLRIFEVFKTAKSLQIVTELYTGSELFDRIKELKKFSENSAASIIKEISAALMHCHRQGVTHRNIKPENIIYESNETNAKLKLIGFGTSLFCDNELEKEMEINYFISPEGLMNKTSDKSDVWSLGVILYLLLSGIPPFKGKNSFETYESIKNGKLEFSHQNWKPVSDEAKTLISKMLGKNPKLRPSIEEVFHDYWVKIRANDLIPDKQVQEASLKSLSSFKLESCLERAVYTFIISQRLNSQMFSCLKDVFLDIDKDGDGVLSSDELKLAVHNMQLDLDVEQIIKECDSDGNGFINYTEFLMATVDKQTAYSREQLKQVFSAFDLNGDGGIDVGEMQTVLGGDRVKFSVVDQIFRETDANGDGVIDFDEFLEQVGKYSS